MRAVFAALLVLSCLAGILLYRVPCADAASSPIDRALWVSQDDIRDPAQRTALVDELSQRLHVTTVRINVLWPQVEPQRGVYNDAYWRLFDPFVDEAKAAGIGVLFMVLNVPEWASDRTFWNDPPPGYAAGVYEPFYPIAPEHMADLQDFAQVFSDHFKGRAEGYEVWCEPNTRLYLWPQQTPADPAFGAHTYAAMLKAFYTGAEAGDPAAMVVAGETSPWGGNNKDTTSPLAFATTLKAVGADRYFDVYSHHPYVLPAKDGIAPSALPDDPRTVSIANISALLSVFPDKPFYLSEFGYNTQRAPGFGNAVVDEATQAAYVTESYRLAAQHSQIKMLLWYPLHDVGQPGSGCFSGLYATDGHRKTAWYAYAGHNSVTTRMAHSQVVARKPRSWVSGTVRSAVTGTVPTQQVSLQVKKGLNTWRTVSTSLTSATGQFGFTLPVAASGRWRVVWDGVIAGSPFRP